MNSILEESRRYLADLSEACQRSAWHLEATCPQPKIGRHAAVCETGRPTTMELISRSRRPISTRFTVRFRYSNG